MADRYLQNAPPPTDDALVGPKGLLTDVWRQWFVRLPATLNSIPSVVNVVTLAATSSSVSSTDFTGGSLKAGLYRASYYAKLTSGALTVTFRWTDGGAAQTWSSSIGSGSTLLRTDASAQVLYSASYVGAGTYALDVVLERVKA